MPSSHGCRGFWHRFGLERGGKTQQNNGIKNWEITRIVGETCSKSVLLLQLWKHLVEIIKRLLKAKEISAGFWTSLPMAGHWNWMNSKVLSTPSHSLWFYGSCQGVPRWLRWKWKEQGAQTGAACGPGHPSAQKSLPFSGPLVCLDFWDLPGTNLNEKGHLKSEFSLWKIRSQWGSVKAVKVCQLQRPPRALQPGIPGKYQIQGGEGGFQSSWLPWGISSSSPVA